MSPGLQPGRPYPIKSRMFHSPKQLFNGSKIYIIIALPRPDPPPRSPRDLWILYIVADDIYVLRLTAAAPPCLLSSGGPYLPNNADSRPTDPLVVAKRSGIMPLTIRSPERQHPIRGGLFHWRKIPVNANIHVEVKSLFSYRSTSIRATYYHCQNCRK